MLLTIVTVYPVPRIANRPHAEKNMWSRCGGAPAIVKWRARFSMSAVDRELHELELDWSLPESDEEHVIGWKRKRRLIRTSLAYRMAYKGKFHSVIAQVSHLTQTSPLRNYLSEMRNRINAV
jgi:hypothetical protein